MKKVLCVIMVFCLVFITGCKTMDNIKKSTLQGAAGGALIGGAAGGVIGKDKKSVAIGAAIGASVGGLLAYELASKLDEERKNLEGKENDLDARIEFARSINRETKEYNAKLSKDIHTIQTSLEDKEADKKKIQSVHEQLVKEVELVKTDLSELKEFRKTLLEDSPKAKLEDLDKQIQELQTNLADLENNTQKLASLNKRIKT